MKTFSATPSDITKHWYVVDAEDQVLGRLASEIAKILRGKHKPIFTPHMDTGDGVIVVNASKVKVTGRKAEQKTYFRHTGYMVYGMLPKTALGRQILRRNLRVYAGAEHPHVAQQPTPLTFSKDEK